MPARKKPIVSVIIPTYNHARFIKETLDSVLEQTFQDFEVLVINNYSEDNTVEILKNIRDPRIRLFNFHNKGVIAASRNFGIGKARGEFLAFLDSDDVWEKNKLELQLRSFRQDPGLLLCGTEAVFFPKKPGISSRIRINGNPRLDLKGMMAGNKIVNSSAVIRSSVLKKTGLLDENPGLRAVEDYDLWLKILNYRDRSAMVIGKPLVKYRIHDSNVLATLDRINDTASMDREFSKIMTVLGKYSGKKGLPYGEIIRERTYHHHRDVIRTRLYGGKIGLYRFFASELLMKDKLAISLKYLIRKTFSGKRKIK